MPNVNCKVAVLPNITHTHTETHTGNIASTLSWSQMAHKLCSIFLSTHFTAAHSLCGSLIWSRAVLSGIRHALPLCAQHEVKLYFNLRFFFLFFLQRNCERIIKAVKTRVFTIACELKTQHGVDAWWTRPTVAYGALDPFCSCQILHIEKLEYSERMPGECTVFQHTLVCKCTLHTNTQEIFWTTCSSWAFKKKFFLQEDVTELSHNVPQKETKCPTGPQALGIRDQAFSL